MKIRGTTVGTSIKPERVLSKPVTLSEEQKAQARENIGACEINDDQVRMDKTWSSAQISAELADINAEFDTCVRHFHQEKTDEEKAQARKNIGAIADGDHVGELTADLLGVGWNFPDDPDHPDNHRGAYLRYLGYRPDGTDMVQLLRMKGEGSVSLGGIAPGVEDTDVVNKGQLDKVENALLNMCPPFTESGAVVACEPVEGYPLTVTAEEGATVTRCGKNLFGGEALADKIVSKKGVKDTTNGTITFHPKDTGELLLFNKFKENTRYTIVLYGRSNEAVSRYANIRISYTDGTSDAGIRFTTPQNDEYVLKTSDASKTVSRIGVTYMGGETCLYYDKFGIFEGAVTANDFEAYVGGNFQQGEQIPAVQGINNLWADSGDITVSGRADLSAKVKRLENAILAMGANV